MLESLSLLGVGVLAGVVNAVAGGATLLTFPALMAAGLPPVVANATNFVGLLPSNAAALPAYRHELLRLGKVLWPLCLIAATGAVLGSMLLIVSPPEVFITLVPFLILLATLLFAFGERLRRLLLVLAGEKAQHVSYGLLLVFSVYGGYFGAGVGIILLATVQLMGFTAFHSANSIKNLLNAGFCVLGILIFGLNDLIAWPEALTLMAGSTIGGFAGGHYAQLVNERLLRAAVVALGLVLSGVYFAP